MEGEQDIDLAHKRQLREQIIRVLLPPSVDFQLPLRFFVSLFIEALTVMWIGRVECTATLPGPQNFAQSPSSMSGPGLKMMDGSLPKLTRSL